MARWRAAAVERLPEFREVIASAKDVMSLWIELYLKFLEAYREPRDDLPRWFTFNEIAAHKGLFLYSIGEVAFNELLAHMQRNRNRYELGD